MTTTTIPAPPEPKHGPDRHFTLPAIKVADLWMREKGEPIPTDWRHEHRQYDPDETTVIDLIAVRPPSTVAARRWGMRALLGRVLARFRRVRVLRFGDRGVSELLGLAAVLTGLGADVGLVDREPAGDCMWCQLEDRDATVTVYGDPDPDDTEQPLDMEVVCHACAPAAVRQACIEQRHDARKAIQVEIGVCPR